MIENATGIKSETLFVLDSFKPEQAARALDEFADIMRQEDGSFSLQETPLSGSFRHLARIVRGFRPSQLECDSCDNKESAPFTPGDECVCGGTFS